MLHVTDTRLSQDKLSEWEESEFGASLPSIEQILAAVRRQIWVLIAGGILGLLLGLAYVLTAVPLYTSSTDILIDKNQSQVVDELATAGGVFKDDAEMMSQVELLKSEQLARIVVTKLNLTENAVFMSPPSSILTDLKTGIKSTVKSFTALLGDEDVEVVADPEAKIEEAALALQESVEVERVGLTYVLSLSYTSPDRALASQIARTYADAYIDDQLNAKFEATRRAGTWLQDRISELRQQAFNSDLAVQKFRSENGLMSAGGTLVSEQQLSEINSQLVISQAATAEAKARYDQIEQIIASGRTEAVVNDALASSTIITLRDKFLDASRRETEISNKLGPDHIQAVRLRDEMAEYQRLIFQEVKRIGDSYNNNYQVALTRQKSLEDSLNRILNVNVAAGTTQVRLRELERQSETFKTLYDNFLKRYQETIQQQSFPLSNARVITAAMPAEFPSHPKKPLLLALFLMLGAASSSGVAAIREYRDRFFRTGDQVRTSLGVEFLGFAPEIAKHELGSKSAKVDGSKNGGSADSTLFPASSTASYVLAHPFSRFAETLRSAKVAVDMALPEQSSKVIGVVSCLPSEGKSTISVNFAQLLAMQGANTLLIDGDMRNPGLSRMLENKPKSGLIEALLNPSEVENSVRRDASGHLTLLPVVLRQRVFHSSEMLTSPRMSKLMNDFRSEFEYIVVDLPPLGPVVDAKAFAHRVDAFIFVVHWGHASRQLVRSIMASNPAIRDKCVGVVLNRSDEAKLKLYRSYGSSEFYHQEYSHYYQR